MPSEPQNTVYSSITKTEGGLGKAHHANLKSAFSNHPDSVMIDNPKTNAEVGDGSQVEFNLDASGIKEFYAQRVKAGAKNIQKSGFPDEGSVDLSYSGAPNLGTITPEGENAPGLIGSTIVSSGLGPNVNVHPIDDISEREMIDPDYENPINMGDGKLGQGSAKPSDNKADTRSIPPGTEGEYDYGTSSEEAPETP